MSRSIVMLLFDRLVLAVGLSTGVIGLIISLVLAMVVTVEPEWIMLLTAVAFALGIIQGIMLYRLSHARIGNTLESYITTLDAVAEGNLNVQVKRPSVDEQTREGQVILRMGDAMERMTKRIQRVIKGVKEAIDQLDADTEEILGATARQISMANEQDAVVTETTATVNEVRATVTETAERAQSVAETAQVSVDISRSGIDSVQETVSGMNTIRQRVEDIADNILVLSEHTQQIGEIIAAVNNLADQSRMLALNASVEAARAGEEGKGFAVVAMEVRNLADQNRDATVQVREILGEIQRATNAAVMVTEEGSKGVDAGQKLVNSAGDAIRDLARAIEEAATAAMQIAASTRQQTIGVDQLTQAMRTIKHATTETVGSTMQVEASVQRLRDAAELINRLLNDLRLE
jgi:methyl-accepting chemotaxis protein